MISRDISVSGEGTFNDDLKMNQGDELSMQ